MLLLLCRHPAKFESLKHVICLGTISCPSKTLDVWWIFQQEMDVFLVPPHRPSSVPPSIWLILYWQTANQFDQLTNTRVASHWNDMMSNLVLPGVLTPLLFVCKPEFLINSSECLGSASISTRSSAFPNRWYNPSYHTVQKSYFTHVNELLSRTHCCNMFHD